MPHTSIINIIILLLVIIISNEENKITLKVKGTGGKAQI